ncbi:hypothetical protein [Candidatus Spyradosoma sp. SGI.093]|uniref:hypothetical protein n=1 Tax=Candidatus Spyradosoma sp. SGI.093 TaxID=3420583 RepID=UPI003D08F1B2
MSTSTRTRKTSAVAWLLFAFSLIAFGGVASPSFAADEPVAPQAAPVLVVRAEAGTRVTRVEGEKRIELGVVGEDGLLVADRGVPAGTQTFVFEHPDALEPFVAELNLAPGAVAKVVPALKMRTGELSVSCLPTDVAIFVDGDFKGRGVLVLGSLEPGREVTVEARSPVYGVSSKRVKIRAGETAKIAFDLRGNIPAQKPDGKIVLPEVQLALASQPGSVVKVDGIPATLSDGALTDLPVGLRNVEIFLPLAGREVSVWRGAFAARSAVMPGADLPAEPLPPGVSEAPAPAPVAEKPDEQPAETAAAPAAPEKIVGKVVMRLTDTRYQISVNAASALKDGSRCRLVVSLDEPPLTAKIVSATAGGVLVNLENNPLGAALKEGATFVLEPVE